MKVYNYDVDGSRHCREGVAVEENGALFDTFWGGHSERHRLTDVERKSVRLIFDTDDFDELDWSRRGEPSEWSERHPSDRAIIPSQHGLTLRWFIRKGSERDYETRLANVRDVLMEAESELRSAESRVKWAREDVQKIEAERVVSPVRGE